MGGVFLFVTWFVFGQPPITYQANFVSMESCRTAQASLLKDSERLRESTSNRFPQVSAVCAAQ